MKKLYFISMVLIGVFLIQCGGNPEQDGDQAFAQKKYNQALSYYLQAKKADSKNQKIDEKIALSYMHKGQQLFARTHNVESFSGNFEKGENFIPETETSPEFDTKYSAMLHELAKAYRQAKPANEIQKEQYFSKTLDLLDRSLTYNPDNRDAEKTLADIKAENFKQTYEKGMRFLKQAKREKNPDLYLTAERYLKRAVFFNPDDKKALSSLKTARKKTLAVLDMDMDFPFAIADKQYKDGRLLLAFTALNNGGETMEFDPLKLVLITSDDQEIALDVAYTEKFDNGLTKKMTLEPRKQIDGTLTFKIKKSRRILSLNYPLTEEKQVRKYFP